MLWRWRRRSRGLGVGQGLVDQLIELAAVDHFDKRRALGVRRHHPDRRGMLDPHPLAKSIIGLDQGRQIALRIRRERKRYAVVLRVLLGKLRQDLQAGNGILVGKDRIARR